VCYVTDRDVGSQGVVEDGGEERRWMSVREVFVI